MSTKLQNQITYVNRSRNSLVTDVMPEGTVRLGDLGDGTWIIEDGDGSFIRVSENDPRVTGQNYTTTKQVKTSKGTKERNQLRALRRNSYNRDTSIYGFNSREDVRKLQRFLLTFRDEYGNQEYASIKNNGNLDGYMGPITSQAYLDAWQKHPNEMRKAGFKEPSSYGPGTVRVGNREVIATDLNINLARKVADADEYVGTNFGTDLQLNMYTLGAIQLLSPTAMYAHMLGLIRTLNGDKDWQTAFSDFLLGKLSGIFETTEKMKAWAEKNPKLAMAANVVLDIIAGGAKGTTTPKVKAMANSVAKNMKTAAKNSFGSMNPRMKIGYNGRFDALPPGDLRIRAYESANLTNQPGLNRIGAEQYSNGHFKSNGVTGWAKQVEITPSYEVNTAEGFENPYYTAALAPTGNQSIVVPNTGLLYSTSYEEPGTGGYEFTLTVPRTNSGYELTSKDNSYLIGAPHYEYVPVMPGPRRMVVPLVSYIRQEDWNQAHPDPTMWRNGGKITIRKFGR